MLKIINWLRGMRNYLQRVEQKIDLIRLSLGNIERRQIRSGHYEEIEFKVSSQWGEDGIIQWLVDNLNISQKKFIEFGVQDYTESNTRYLLMHNNWAGLIIDGSKENIEYVMHDDIYWRYNLKAVHKFITAENINDIFVQNGIVGEIGLLSVDIDGNDYWVWKAIKVVQPDIVICEYNHRFGADKAVTVPYDANFVRAEKHYSCIYYGASIKALTKLAETKGYSLVAGNKSGNNVFFVKNELLNDTVKKREVNDIFAVGQFRESRNVDNELSFLDAEAEQRILWSLPLEEV